jgi:hypothetical protein
MSKFSNLLSGAALFAVAQLMRLAPVGADMIGPFEGPMVRGPEKAASSWSN